jgi:hypothetical protein
VAVVQRIRRWFAERWHERRWESLDRPDAGPAVRAVVDGEVVNGELTGDEGMSTVEYAVGTVVAAAFAAVLYKIVTGDSVVAGLTSLVNSAMHTSL